MELMDITNTTHAMHIAAAIATKDLPTAICRSVST